jgi:hypothetical protein
MFHIFKKAAQTGLVTIGYPHAPAQIPEHFRGAPELRFCGLGGMRAPRRSLSHRRHCHRGIGGTAAGHDRLRASASTAENARRPMAAAR